MELRQIASTLWKWTWLIVLATAVAAVSSWLVVKDQPAIYQTSTTLMIGRTIEQVSPDTSEFYTAQLLAQSYSELVRREPILRMTAAALGFEEQWRSLRGQVSAALVAGTQLMEIRVVDTDPVRAKRIAEEVTRQLLATVEQDRPQDSQLHFIQEQVAALPSKIETAQEEISELEVELGQAFSAREIQDLETRINTLEGLLNNWRATFAQYQLLLGNTGVNVLTVVEEAPVPTRPVGRRWQVQVVLAAAIGAMLAVGAAFLIEYLDDTVKSPQDVERATNLPTLGVIVRFPRSAKEGPVTAVEPRSAIAEGYRVLRTNLQFASMSLGKSAAVLLVTSAQPTEGKTTSLANLGVSLAQAGKRVLLVDTDLRRPGLHKLFNMPKEVGLTSLLLEREADVEHVIQKTGVEGLRVLPSGPLPANPTDVLGYAEMGALLEQLRGMADYVLLDSPPVLSVADTSVLAQKADGVLMVVEAGQTRTERFKRAVAVLQGVKARVLGTILTKVAGRRRAYSDDYYYYYSSYYADEAGMRKKKGRDKGASTQAPEAVRRRSRVPLWQVGVLILVLLSATIGALMYAGFLPLPNVSLPFDGRQVQSDINQGYSYFIVEDYEAAIQSFNQALALEPANEDARLGLQHATQYLELRDLHAEARALMEQNLFDEAIAKLQAITQIDPWYKDAEVLLLQCQSSQQLEALYIEAMGYYNGGDWARAAAAFEALQAKGAAEREAEVKSKLFDCYLSEGRAQIAAANSRSTIMRATQSFTSALWLFPDDAAALEEKRLASLYLDGYTAHERADWRQAVDNLSRIYAARPDYAQGQVARLLCESYTKLGDAYQATGELKQALDQYRLVLTLEECDQTEALGKEQQVLALLGPATPSPTAMP